MNILILGSGGREHALAWKISQSSLCSQLFIAKGNAGTGICGKNVDIDPDNFPEVGHFALENNIEIIVVGPEEPLVRGIDDFFSYDPALKDISIIGPGSFGAMLEGSKAYAKNFMKKYNIPTAKHKTFDLESIQEGLSYLESINPPYVLKADGLAGGKGVIICQTLEEAKKSLRKMLDERMFGDASSRVVVEEFLKGKEVSVFIATDGSNYVELPSAKDYKRVGEGDTGPNTGGMGCVSPVPFIDNSFMEKVREQIIKPTIKGLKEEDIHYKGFIFFGVIKVNDDPYLIEYNVRLGDPEAEVILPRIDSDFVSFLKHMSEQTLKDYVIEINNEYAAAIMLVSGGYPGDYDKGFGITGADKVKDSILYYAGAKQQNGGILTSGGRVLAVVSLDKDLKKALNKSKETAKIIDFHDKYYRKDIGNDLL